MEREQLVNSLRKGLPISERLHKMEKKLGRAENPMMLSIIVAAIIFWVLVVFLFSNTNDLPISVVLERYSDPSYLVQSIVVCIIASAIAHFVPLVNFIPLMIGYLLGKLFFSGKQKQLGNEIASVSYTHLTLPTMAVV